MNFRAGRYAAPVLITTALALSGCGALSGEGTGTEERQVAAAFYPLEYAAERIAGDHFDIVNLTTPGTEPHDLELSVKKTGQVADSALVIFQTGFQPAVDQAVEHNATGEALDAAEVIDLVPMGEHVVGPDSHDAHAEEEGHDGHAHGEFDPHFWLDPLLMADFSDEVAARMASIDPDHSDDFTANAAELRKDLEALDQAYAEGLANCERSIVVVNHDAFGYLARYGIQFEAMTGISPGAEVTVADRKRLQQLIRTEGLTTVFSEPLVGTKAADTLAVDVDVRVETLDPIEGLTDLNPEDDYLSLMTRNLELLQEANGC